MTKLIISLFIVLLGLQFGYSQTIQVIDAENKYPIPNVHICTESDNKLEVNYWVTDNNGKTKNTISRKAKIAISFIGYHTLIDSILPGTDYTFKLNPHSEDLSEVVITGQIAPETVDKSIYKVQVINRLQIENKAANNLGDLLNNELNININNSGILGNSMQMQGLSGEHIKILIDGVPVIGRQNGNIDLNQLNIQNVDHVEIIEGPMSVVYGSNAIAGAINIITKNNTRPKYNASINMYYESVGVYNIDVGGTINRKGHHLDINTGRNFFDGYSLYDNNSRTFSFDPKEQYFGNINYGFSNKKYQISLVQDAFYESLMNYGSVYTSGKIFIDTNFYSFPMADDVKHTTLRTNTKLIAKYILSDHANIDFLAAYSYYNHTKQTYHKNFYYLSEILNTDTTTYDTTIFKTFTSRATYSHLAKKLDFQGGYDLTLESADGKRIQETHQINDYNAFLSLKYKPVKTVAIQAGARYIYNTKFNAPIVYSINGKWDIRNNLNLRVSYGKGFRSPSIKELYLYFVDINHEVKGNANLKAENSQNYNLSINYNFGKRKNNYSFALKLYHNRINDKIDYLFDSIKAAKADYINIDGVYKSMGGQLDFTYQLHPRFQFKTGINYYGVSKFSNLNEYTYTPDFIASFNYHNVKYLFRINIYYKYCGKQSQFYEKQKDGETIIEERYLSAYHMLNASVNRPFFNEKLLISVGFKNILNVKTVEGTGNTSGDHSGGSDGNSNIAWGRTFFVKLKFNITKF